MKPKKRSALRAARTPPAADLEELDSGWHSFISRAAGAEDVTAEWPDPTGAPGVKRKIRAATQGTSAARGKKKTATGKAKGKSKANAKKPKKKAAAKKK